jgi:PAS domain-containing protein
MINEEMDFTDAKMLREKAEKRLNEKQKEVDRALLETDANKLLHELQVHQIELEMQNDELRQAYETAETALKKYTMLFDLSPLGYFSLDSDGTICDLNFTGADMLGERRFSLINSNFKLFISDDSKPVFNSFFRKVYTSNSKESCEVVLGYNHKSLCRVYMEGVVTEDEQKCLISVVDISKFSNM